jgi:hypothetical protein
VSTIRVNWDDRHLLALAMASDLNTCNNFILQNFFFMDFIALSKYFFLFRFQNPTAMQVSFCGLEN